MSGVDSGSPRSRRPRSGSSPSGAVSADTASATARGRERSGPEGDVHGRRGGVRQRRRRASSLLDAASEESEIAPRPRDRRRRRASGRSVERSITVQEIAAKRGASAVATSPSRGTGARRSMGAPSVAAHLAHVRVDRETGEIELLRHTVAQHVGRALNPALVEEQSVGGATQGIGWALRGADARRRRAARDRLVPRLRDPRRRAGAGDRHADRRGPGARRPVRAKATARRRNRRRASDRERHRRRSRGPAPSSFR